MSFKGNINGKEFDDLMQYAKEFYDALVKEMSSDSDNTSFNASYSYSSDDENKKCENKCKCNCKKETKHICDNDFAFLRTKDFINRLDKEDAESVKKSCDALFNGSNADLYVDKFKDNIREYKKKVEDAIESSGYDNLQNDTLSKQLVADRTYLNDYIKKMQKRIDRANEQLNTITNSLEKCKATEYIINKANDFYSKTMCGIDDVILVNKKSNKDEKTCCKDCGANDEKSDIDSEFSYCINLLKKVFGR